MKNIEYYANEFIPIKKMLSPWEAADKYFPGGFKEYFKLAFGLNYVAENKK